MVKSGTDVALTALGILGNITSMGLFLSPLPTFYQICKTKSTGQYSSVPYVSTLLNCMLWTFYGAGAVGGLIFVMSINFAGVIFEGTYVMLHIVYGDPASRKATSMLFAAVCVLYTILVSVVLVAIKSKDDRVNVVGSVCIVIGVIMYASPLSVMKEVIRTESVESMPFLLSFACFSNGLIWTLYGSIKKDMYIYIPNGLGTFLTVLQLTMWCFYYNKSLRKASDSRDNTADEDSSGVQSPTAPVEPQSPTKETSSGDQPAPTSDSEVAHEAKSKGLNEIYDTALIALC